MVARDTIGPQYMYIPGMMVVVQLLGLPEAQQEGVWFVLWRRHSLTHLSPLPLV